MRTTNRTRDDSGRGAAVLERPKKRAAEEFAAFRERVLREFFGHPVVVRNPYTRWFREGEANTAQVEDLFQQFSVLSHHFIVAQAKHMVHAETAEGELRARYILVNELGVAVDAATGSSEGRTFSAFNAHVNWLRAAGAVLGLDPRSLGRWQLGTKATREFLEGLEDTYGSLDGRIGAGASFAIENWAAFGIGQGPEKEADNFWKELIVGIEKYNERHRRPSGLAPIPTRFFQYHFDIELGHCANVWKELEEDYAQPGFDAAKFIAGGRRALDFTYVFWRGLDQARRKLA